MKSFVSIPTYLLGGILALVALLIGLLCKEIIIPLIVWVAKQVWKQARKLFSKKPPKEAPKFISELSTPDIFKGSPNLAPARQMDVWKVMK